MKQSQGGNGGGKMWIEHINKKGRADKSQKQQQSDKNVNGYINSKNGFRLVDIKWMFLFNKVCGFNNLYITGFHDTWSACVKNNKPFTLPVTHVFQKKIVASSITVPRVYSNNGGGTQSPPPINGGTDTATDGGL